MTAKLRRRLPPTQQGPVAGQEVMAWCERLEEESKRQRRAIVQCMGVGLLMDCVVVGLVLLLVRIVSKIQEQHRTDSYKIAALVGMGICCFMLLIAWFTKPSGRAEMARRVFDDGMEAACRQGGPVAGAGATLLMLIALYGAYAIVEASKRTIMRCRLSLVDPYETARIMAAIAASPVGVPWKNLLKFGQSTQSLRGPIAALMLDGWIELVDGGTTLIQGTPSMRLLLHRHPLEDAFLSGE